jgi:exonuclease III
MLNRTGTQQQNEDAHIQIEAESNPHHTPNALQRLQIARAEWSKFGMHDGTNSTRPMLSGSRAVQLSVENQRVNTAWGDLLEEKTDNVTRVYCLNVNGFTLDRRGGQFEEFCTTANEVQADIIGCQEHNLDTTQPSVKSILYDTAQRVWTRSKLQFGTTPITYTNMYKPGGTMLASLNHTTGRVIAHQVDKWGRWTSQTLRGKHDRRITVISVYQVVVDTPGSGLVTAAAQQRSLLLDSEDQLTDPRQAFIRDLKLYLDLIISQGDEVLLMGDFNESVGVERNPTSSMLSELGLVNLMTNRHPTPLPATYARGRKCLDYGFATRKVADALVLCGYEAFNHRYTTDHRSYFFDFNTDLLFGAATPQLASPQSRILKSTNVKQVTSYIKIVYDLLLKCNAFERARRLTLPGNRHAYAERLDKDMVQASLAAEKRIKPYGEPAWSITLDQSRKKLNLLRKCLSMMRTGRDLTTIIDAQNAALNEPIVLPINQQECFQAMRAAKSTILDNVAISIELREAEVKKRIQQLQLSSKKSDAALAVLLRRMHRVEAIKRLFAKLRAARVKGNRKGVVALEIPVHPESDPKTCSEWRTIDVPTEIVEQLQRRNRKHFGQADGSPFTVPPLSDGLGFCGDGEIADDILHGRYDSSPLHDNIHLLLQHLRITQEMIQEESYPTITEKEFRGKLKVWRETTSTSPSGLHLGHWKALIARHAYSDEEDPAPSANPEDPPPVSNRDEWNHMQNELFDLHLNMINYALERGYSYQRWQKIVNTMIFKDPDNVKIHRTRVIHIYEADFNMVLGLKWRMALYQAEALKQLNDGQYGSRPARNAIDPVMIEELQFEISRISRRMMIQTNYDATACYDRIIPNLAMLASKKFGVHPQVTKTNATTLLKARYHIRTELGVSPESYSHSELMPIFGTGQGSGNSPMLWLFLCCILFAIYASLAKPAKYCNPDGTNEIILAIVGFVDDCNGQVNCFMLTQNDHTLQLMLQHATSNAKYWADLLSVTGGALELSKCSYHVMYWKFSAQGAPVLTNMKAELPPISVSDPHTQQEQVLEYLHPYAAHKTLGHYKEPSGIQVQQVAKLKDKSDSITEFLWRMPLTRSEAWTYYSACYLPSVTYPLTASFLTSKQLQKVQTRAMSIIVPRCGYNRNTHRSIIYGPHRLGGAGFRHLAVEQGVLQVTYFLRHVRQQSQVGKLILCALSWLQLSVGVSYPVLEQPLNPLPHIESLWLTSLRDFLASHKLSIQMTDTGIPPLQREHDTYIMDHILQANHYTKAEVRKINYCRMFLQAVTVSDLSHPDGTSIDLLMMQGQDSEKGSRTAILSIHQERPSDTEWKLWRRANLLWSTLAGTLRQPLGQWLHPIQAQRRHQFAYRYRRRVWIRMEDDTTKYQEYRIRSSNEPLRQVHRTSAFTDLPTQAHPASVLHSPPHSEWILTHQGHSLVSPPEPFNRQESTFAAFITTLDEWERNLLQYVELPVDPFSFCVELQPYLRAVSDGSVRTNKHSSFGWAIRDEAGTPSATGMGPAPGGKPTSYRAEAYGMLSLMRFLIRIAEFTDMQFQWQGILGTDSQSLLDTLSGKDKDPQAEEGPIPINGSAVILDPLCPDWDVLIEIQLSQVQLPGIKLQHVRGHQDRTTAYHRLDQMGQLNVDADAKAGQFQDEHGSYRSHAFLMHHTRAQLLGPQGTITSHFANRIRYLASAPPLRAYLLQKYQWSPENYKSVHWDAHGSALTKMNKRCIHFTKLVYDILPTTAQANRYDHGKRTCPQCPCEVENRDHVLRCPSASAAQWRIDFEASILQFFQETQTTPVLTELALSAFEKWFSATEEIILDPQAYPPQVAHLILEQNAIGWRQLFNGRFSREWSKIQDMAYTRAPPPEGQQRRTGDRWQVKFILKLWDEWDARWTDRNKALHGHNTATRTQAMRRETQRELENIYRQRPFMEPQVQALLLESPEAHTTQPVSTTRNWIATNRSVFRNSVRRVKTRALRGVRSIRTYFQPSNGG